MSQTEYREPSGWATGAVLFAGILMIIIGIFEAFQGLNAIFEDQFYVVTENYLFDIDVTAWGWIHLLLGILVIFGGYAVMAGRTWAGSSRSSWRRSPRSRTSCTSLTTPSGRSS